jgi:Fic family protein
MKENRQNVIIEFLESNPQSQSSAIIAAVMNAISDRVSRPTILRDIDSLLAVGKITKSGIGRATLYSAAIDVEEYFNVDPDRRIPKSEYFNFDIWQRLNNLFDKKELAAMDELNEEYRENRSKLSPVAFRKELERLTIEFAWKSSKIEGNTYTLLDTERLILEQVEADGKAKAEAVMILNHKAALDFIFADPVFFQEITLAKIEQIHRLLTGGLEVESGIRQRRVGITGTNYRPLDNAYQIKEALEKLDAVIGELRHPLEKALAAVLMISYIQPFEDGNKRTARTIGNAILLAFGYCPLSYRSADEIEYKKGMILFYEQNDWTYFKTIFTDQFKQAVKKYF